MNCSEALDLVGEALEDSLAADARIQFEDHLQECPSCRTYVDQLRLTLSALEHVPTQGIPNRRRSELIDAFRKSFR